MSLNQTTRRDTPAPLSLEAFKAVGDVRISLTAELGRRFITLDELLRFQVNDVFTLLRSTGEHVDLLAEDVVIGTAEIVATDENLSVHIVDLLEKSKSCVEVERPGLHASLPGDDDSGSA